MTTEQSGESNADQNMSPQPIRPPGRRGLKAYVEHQPFFVITSVVLVVATTTGSIVQYFAQERASLQQTAHRLELAQQQQERDDILRKFTRYLSSIGVGIEDEERLLDVTEIPIRLADVPTLAEGYTAVEYSGADGRFYVAVPELGNWTMKSMSELDMMRQQLPEGVIPEHIEPIADLVSEERLVAWQSATTLDVSVSDSDGNSLRLSLVPSVSVQKLDREFFSRAFEAARDMQREKEEMQDAWIGILERLEELTNRLAQLGEGTADVEITGIGRQDDDRQEIVPEVDRALDALARIFGGSMSALVLAAGVQEGLLRAMEYGGSYDIHAAEKKGNVLYVRSLNTFDVTLDGMDETSRVFLIQEVLYIGMGEEGTVVNIFIPAMDLRSESYAWTRGWLTMPHRGVPRAPVDGLVSLNASAVIAGRRAGRASAPCAARHQPIRRPGADSRAAPAGCGTSLREVRLEPETRNSRGRTARPPGCSGHGGRCRVSFRGSHGHRTARGARPAAHAWSTPSSPDAGVTPDLDLSTAAAVDNLQRWPTS